MHYEKGFLKEQYPNKTLYHILISETFGYLLITIITLCYSINKNLKLKCILDLLPCKNTCKCTGALLSIGWVGTTVLLIQHAIKGDIANINNKFIESVAYIQILTPIILLILLGINYYKKSDS